MTISVITQIKKKWLLDVVEGDTDKALREAINEGYVAGMIAGRNQLPGDAVFDFVCQLELMGMLEKKKVDVTLKKGDIYFFADEWQKLKKRFQV